VDIHVVYGSKSCLPVIEEGALYGTSPRIPTTRDISSLSTQIPATLGEVE